MYPFAVTAALSESDAGTTVPVLQLPSPPYWLELNAADDDATSKEYAGVVVPIPTFPNVPLPFTGIRAKFPPLVVNCDTPVPVKAILAVFPDSVNAFPVADVARAQMSSLSDYYSPRRVVMV